MALNDANCLMVSQHLWTQVRVWSISWSRSLIEISELMLSKSNFSSRTRPVGPLCSWQCFGHVLLNHRQGLEKNFWYWFIVSLFVCYTLFLCHFVCGLSSQLSTSLIFAENRACTYLPFCSNAQMKTQMSFAWYSISSGKCQRRKRKREDGKTNKRLICNFRQNSHMKPLPKRNQF